MMDIAELRACPPKTLGLDSGFRRRKPESTGIKEEFEIYTIMALLVIER
jgi:hypothetical protein